MSWQVALILDHETDPGSLLGQMPVWAVSTPLRQNCAAELRSDWDGLWNPEPGFTLVTPSSEDDLVSAVVDLVPTLEEHHPSMTCVRLIGVTDSVQLQQAIASLGYNALTSSHGPGLRFGRPIETLDNVREFILDANGWRSADDVYDAFFRAVRAPSWHGRNLDALDDSISTGEINETEVPYRLIIRNASHAGADAAQMIGRFQKLIEEIQSSGCPVAITVHQ